MSVAHRGTAAELSTPARVVAAGGAAGLLILVAALAAGRPSYAVLSPAPLIAWLVWRHAMARLAFVVVGGLFVFVSNTNHLTVTKAAFFAGLVLVVVAILRQPDLYRDLRRDSTIRALLPVTLALAVLVVVGFAVARSMHTGLSPWLRDVAAYGLAAVVPLLLWDFDRNASAWLSRLARMLLLLCGVLSGLSFVVQWLGQRQILSSTTTLHILPGEFLPAALALFLAVSAGKVAKDRNWYTLGALAIPILLVLAGTRSALPVLVCVVLALFAGWENKRSLLVWTAGAIAAAAAALAGLVVLAHSHHGGLARLTVRITSIPHTILHLGSDQSYKERAAEWHAAWATFKGHELLGVGPGHTFVWRYAGVGPLQTLSRYNLDTPVVFLAKFGIVGIIALVIAIYGLIRFLRMKRPPAIHDVRRALTWYLVLAVVTLPFGWPLEQKDFTLGLILLGALAVPRAVVAAPGFEGDWAAWSSAVDRLDRRMASFRGVTALLLVLGGAVVALAIALAVKPASSGTARGGASGTNFATPKGRAVAAADAAVWAAKCGPTCKVKIRPANSLSNYWLLTVRKGSTRSCSLLDTSRFRPTASGFDGVDPIRCEIAPPPRPFSPNSPAVAAINADVAIWSYSHCGKHCRHVVKPVSPEAGLWKVRLNQPGGASCYLFDTRRFARRGSEFAGVDPMRC